MATLVDNNIYLDIDGTVVSSYFLEVTLEPIVESQDTTHGSGTDFRQRAPGLKDYNITIKMNYDTTAIATLLPLCVGQHTVTYGPDTNATGKPKHVQSFIFEGAPHTVTIDKTPVALEISGVGADAPTTDMYANGVWA